MAVAAGCASPALFGATIVCSAGSMALAKAYGLTLASFSLAPGSLTAGWAPALLTTAAASFSACVELMLLVDVVSGVSGITELVSLADAVAGFSGATALGLPTGVVSGFSATGLALPVDAVADFSGATELGLLFGVVSGCSAIAELASLAVGAVGSAITGNISLFVVADDSVAGVLGGAAKSGAASVTEPS